MTILLKVFTGYWISQSLVCFRYGLHKIFIGLCGVQYTDQHTHIEENVVIKEEDVSNKDLDLDFYQDGIEWTASYMPS